MKRRFRIKPGYIIIAIIIVIYYIIHRHNIEQERREYYTKYIQDILDDFRRGEYFKIQNYLDSTLLDKVSIDNIDNLIKDVKISKNDKFKLNRIDEQNRSNILIDGDIIKNSSKALKLSISFKDINSSLYIKSLQIGSKKLEDNITNDILKIKRD